MKKICKTKLLAMLLLSACGGQPASAGMAGPAASGSVPESVAAPGSVPEPEEEPDTIVYEGWNRDAKGCDLHYLCSEGFDYAEEFYNGYAFAMRGLDCGYVDRDGNFTVGYQINEELRYKWFGDEFFNGSVISATGLAEGRAGNCFGVSEEGLYPYCEMDGGSYYESLWGYKDIHTGEIVIPAQYETPAPFREGRAVVRPREQEDGQSKTSYVIDTNGEVVFSTGKIYQGYFSGGMLRTGLVEGDPLKDNCVVDRNGNILISLAPGNGSLWAYTNLYLTVENDNYAGDCRNDAPYDPEHIYTWTENEQGEKDAFYINSRGERTLDAPADVFSTSIFRGGFAVIITYENGEFKYGLINGSGEVVAPAIYDGIGSFGYNGDPAVLDKNDYSYVKEGENYYIINTDIEKVDEEAYEALSYYQDGLMAAQKNGKWGYVKPGESVAIDFVYDSASDFANGIASVEKDGEFFYIDQSGTRLTGAYTEYYHACKEDAWLAFHSDEEHPFNFAVRSNG